MVINEIKNKISITELVQKYGAKREGKSGNWLCCLHNDHQPSLTIDEASGLFYCHGCKKGGDIFNFMIFTEKCDFSTALRKLAQIAGISLMPLTKEQLAETKRKREEQEKVYAMLGDIADVCHGLIDIIKIEGKTAREFIKQERGFTDETIDNFKIGFFDEEVQKELEKKYSIEDLLKTGCFIKWGNGLKPFFNNRIFFPYFKTGHVVYAIGRKTILTPDNEYEQGKYKKSPIGEYIDNKYLYGEDSLTENYAIIAEGITDCISALQAGYPCISSVGLAIRQQERERIYNLLKNLDGVYIIPDSEVSQAGYNAALETAKFLFSKGLTVFVCEIPRSDEVEKIDLNDYLKEGEPNKKMKELLNFEYDKGHAKHIFDILVERILKLNPDKRIESIRELLLLIQNKEPFALDNYLEQIVGKFKKAKITLAKKALEKELSLIRREAWFAKLKAEQEKKEKLSEEEEKEVKKILEEGDPLAYCIETVGKIHVGDKPVIAKLILSGLSSGFKDRKLVFHSKEVGSFSKGKSSVHDHASLIFDNVEMTTSSSAKAQFYKAAEGRLPDAGIVIFHEAEGSEEAIVLERTLTDDTLGNPKHDTVIDGEYVGLEVNTVNAVWKNLASIKVDDQLDSRYLSSNVDESTEQDKAVFEKTLEQFGHCDFGEKNFKEFRIARAITRKIKEKPVKILIPYYKAIETANKENRRTLKKFMRLLYAVIYCYRFQRPVWRDYIVSALTDFRIASAIWQKAVSSLESTTGLDEKHIELLKKLPQNEIDATGRQELAEKLKVSIATVYNRLKILIEKGLVNYKEIKTEETKKKLYWAIRDYQPLSFNLDNSLERQFYIENEALKCFFEDIVRLLANQEGSKINDLDDGLIGKIRVSQVSNSLTVLLNPPELNIKSAEKAEKQPSDSSLQCSDQGDNLLKNYNCAICNKSLSNSEANFKGGLVYCKDCVK